MQPLIAKCFIDVEDLLERGYTIPKLTPLVDVNGHEQGCYMEHVKTEHVDYHTMRNAAFRSTPFYIRSLGIMLEIELSDFAIENKLKIKPKRRCKIAVTL